MLFSADCKLRRRSILVAALLFLLPFSAPSENSSQAAIIHAIDAAVAARNDNVLGYTVTEHYSVLRNKDQQPAAEMTVRTTYERDKGKNYVIESESGSSILRKEVLDRVLDNEKVLTQPANRATAVITSANYEMNVRGNEPIEGRDCIALSITPRRSSPYLFKGTIWVDPQDYGIVKLAGTAVRSPSFVTGPAEISRIYARIDGYPMATRATAVSNSWLFGETTIHIEYTGYNVKFRAEK